jgi:uncharacterized membrane protein YqhA
MDTQRNEEPVKKPEEQQMVERVFEGALWNSRHIVILAVIFSVLSAIILFIAGSLEVISTISTAISLQDLHVNKNEMMIGFIGAIDFYLIAVVLLIFSFGIYELFISKIDIARDSEAFHTILEIKNLDDLKNKIIKVIIMVLIVSFFQRILSLTFTTATDMLFMAASIAAICIGVYYLQKLKL